MSRSGRPGRRLVQALGVEPQSLTFHTEPGAVGAELLRELLRREVRPEPERTRVWDCGSSCSTEVCEAFFWRDVVDLGQLLGQHTFSVRLDRPS